MKTLVDGYFRLLKLLMFLCMVGMVVMVFGNVVMRYAFNSGLTMSEELARFLFVWMTFLGAIVALREHAHLGVDTLIRRLPPLGRRFALLLGHTLMLYVCWLITTGSWQQTQINLSVPAPATGLSMGAFYGVGVLFGISAAAVLLYEAVRIAFGRTGDHELVMVASNDAAEEVERLQHEQQHAGKSSAPGAKA
ncbi:C4-dicarboxylate ABC transporter permease [Thauera propionica]|uniref:TRAP transporter small permease protein n=1 Tax=Thauera propionica TaxID=2019431 RepID=A0A235F2P9_9RHOO|nr:TRAP transporter small permease [Thauera propionica]OYD55157.1 C4-dicarboxylate ABC transporter permease [Thauera propionica]